MSIVSDAVSASLAVQSDLHGETITYARSSAGISIEISGAMQGDTNWDANNPQPGLKIGERSVDWLIEYSQLVSGSQLTPERGDTITTADGRTFRCLPFGSQDLLYRWVDRGGRTWVRIHTKER